MEDLAVLWMQLDQRKLLIERAHDVSPEFRTFQN